MSSDRAIRIDRLTSEGPELAALFAGEPYLELRQLGRPGLSETPGRELWVLRVAETLSGVLILDAEPGGAALELTLAIAPARRREGLARVLLAAAREHAEQQGAGALRAVVDERNEGAAAFFSAQGFVPEPSAPARHLAFRLDL